MEFFKEEEKLLLLEAALTSSTLIEGFDCIRKANIYQKGLYYQAFLSLSTGIERLLKLLIIYEYKINNQGAFPDNKQLKEKGHNLYEMFKMIAPDALEDELNNLLIKFLSDFAMTTRYYNLDVLTGKQFKSLNPLEEWSVLEEKILNKYNAKYKKTQDKAVLANMLNETASVLYLDNSMKQIDNFMPIIDEVEKRDAIQGYSVLAFFKIIKALVHKLARLELDNDLFPYLREFFDDFRGNRTDGEIRKKKNWRNNIY